MKTTLSSRIRYLWAISLAAGLAAFVLPSSVALGADVTWATASDGNWTNGSDWAGGNPPANDATGTGDTARFDDVGTYTVTLDTNRSVRNLYIMNNANPVFDFTGYTLTVGNITRTHNNSVATLVGGTISGSWYQGYNGGNNSLFTITGTNAHIVSIGGSIGYGDGNLNNNLNTLVISNGASFTNTNAFAIGQSGGSSYTNMQANSNKVVVTGVGSTFGSSTSIRIGTLAAGTATGRQISGNALVIDDGATVGTPQVLIGYVSGGSGASLTNNTLTVGGTGATATLNLTGVNSLLIGSHDGGNAAIINTGGIINATNGAIVVGAFAGNTLRVNGGTLNATGQLVNVGNDATMFLGSNGVVNAGIVNIEADARFGDKSDAANAGFTSGTLNVSKLTNQAAVVFSVGDDSGTNPAILNLVGTNIHEFRAGITIEQSDGQLTGNGTIRGLGNTNTTLTVNGVVSPGNSVGTINVTGDLLSGTNAVFNFEIGGLSSFDQLLVSGDFAFDGTLNLSLIDSFMPEAGNSFQLFDFTSSSGSFGTLNLAALDGGKSWDVSNLYTTGVVQVVPEPTTLGLLALGGLSGLAVLLRHRKIICWRVATD